MKLHFFLLEKCGSTKFSFFPLHSHDALTRWLCSTQCVCRLAPHEEAPCVPFWWLAFSTIRTSPFGTKCLRTHNSLSVRNLNGLPLLLRNEKRTLGWWSVFRTKNSPYQLPKSMNHVFIVLNTLFLPIRESLTIISEFWINLLFNKLEISWKLSAAERYWSSLSCAVHQITFRW